MIKTTISHEAIDMNRRVICHSWQYIPHETHELYHYGVKGMKWGLRKDKKLSTNDLVVRKASDHKTPKMSSKEYAHVMSELRNNINKRQKASPVFSKHIGNYTYTFENHFDDTYRIIGRKKIPQSTTGILKRINDGNEN